MPIQLIRVLVALALAALFPSLADAAIYYVSNEASHGYAVGANTNPGTSAGAPFLTIAKCTSVTSAGDTCTINASATPYSEDSGSGYLSFGSGATVQGDPVLCGAGSVPTIQAASSTTIVVDVPTSAALQTLACVKLDSQLGASRVAVVPHTNANLWLSQVSWVNSNTYLIGNFGGTWNLTLDRINVDASNTLSGTTLFGFYATSAAGTLTFYGGSLAAPSVTTGQLLIQTSHISTIAFNLDGNGNRLTFSGPANYQFRVSSTANIASMTGYLGFNGTSSGVNFSQGTITSYDLHLVSQNLTGTAFVGGGFTSSSGSITFDSFVGNYPAVGITSEFASNQHVNNGTFSITAGGSPGYFIQPSGGAGFQVNGNAFTLAAGDSLNTFISFGPDGITTEASNTGSATGTQKIGDVANDTIVCQGWTSTQIGSTTHFPNMAALMFYLKKTGSPAGTLTAQLYSDSAGAPASVLATSTTSLAASSLTASSAGYEFVFNPPPAVSGSTAYHVCLTYSGSNDGTNYVLADTNTTVTEGSIHTAPTSSGAWTANGTHALRNSVYTSAYQTVNPQANDNRFTLLGTGDGARELQGIQLGSSYSPQALRNFFQVAQVGGGVGYGILAKSSYGTPLISGNGIVVGAGPYGGIYDKAAFGTVTISRNTIVINGTATTASGISVGPDTLGESNPFYPPAPTGGNNIIAALVGYPFNVSTGASIGTFDYDDLYAPGGIYEYTSGANWATWRGTGQEAHGINTSPLLTNQAAPTNVASMVPLMGSPAYRGGTPSITGTAYDVYGVYYASLYPTIGAFSGAASTNQLLARVAGASTVYAIVRDATGRPWNNVTGALETYATADYSTYPIGLVQQGSSGAWIGPMPGGINPSPPGGIYQIDYRVMVGAAPAESDTIIAVGKLAISWSGSAELGPIYCSSTVQ